MKRVWKRWSALLLAAAMCLSLLPAAALAAPRSGEVIDVTDYGADPTGVKESSTAVIAALAAAKELPEGTQKTIFFPKGEYHFYEDYSETRELYASNTLRWNERDPYANKPIGILVEGMKNVTIDGGGSLFIYHGNVCTMAAIDSENVTFTNFSEDFASPEVVDVTVEAHEGTDAAILFIPACYHYTISGTNINWTGEISPVTGQPYWSGNNGFLSYRQYLDTVTGRSSSGGSYPFSNVSSITQVDDTHIKVVYSNAGSRPPVGQCCQMRHPNPRKTPGVFFLNSKDITLSNANFHFLHGFGMVGQLSENITLDTVKCQARPGTGRTSAGFADFVQMSSIAGKVTVRNCEFADPHDDPINIHGTFLEVQEITADRRRVVVKYMHNETWGFPQYNVGDTVDFSVKDTMAPVANSTRTVVGVVNPGEGVWLDGTPRSKNNENDMRTIIVELDEPIPAGISANHDVMENVTHTPEVLIENCRFTETPTRGILVTTRKPVVIRNNYFDRICSSSIFISCDAQDWRESGHSEDVLITGNTFIAENITGLGDHYGGTGIIMIWPTNPSDDPNYQIHKNIRIEENVFSILPMGSAKRAIVAKSVNGLTIKDNLFQRYSPDVELTLSAGSTALTAGGTQATSLTSAGSSVSNRLFRLQACKNIVFEGNTYDDGLNLAVQLDGSVVTAADVTDKDGVLTVGGDNQLPAVGAVRYFSSDPSVATVDESGVVTGVSAGTATITAYRVAGARTFESAPLTFTVTGEAAAPPSKIDITSDTDAVEVGGTVNLTAAVTPSDAGSVAWAVKSAAGGGAATVTSSGVLTATAPGVVEVTASLGGVTASKLITVNKPNFVYLSDLDWTSATTGDGSWNGGQPIKDRSWESEKGNNGVRPVALYDGTDTPLTFEKGIGTHAESIIKYDLSGMGFTTLTGRAGVSYYQHDQSQNAPNLHFAVLCDGVEQVTRDSVYNQAAPEAFSVNIAGAQELTLKVTSNKTGNGAFWGAHGNWADAKLFTDNAAPTATNVAAAAGAGQVTVNYTYADADSDAEDGSLITWYVSDTQTGHYAPVEGAHTGTLTVTAAISEKWVRAVVVPKDATGRYGAPVTSPAVQAPAQTPVANDATLASLSASGLTLSPAFDPAVTEYTVSVPASASKVTLTATATQAAATVSGAGEVTLTGTETGRNIVVTAPNGSTTKTYTVTIRRAASSDATLSNLTASAGSAAITYDPATRFYELTADQTAQSLTFSAVKSDENAKIEVRYNAEEKGEYAGQMTLPLTAGLNNLELRVTAQDGISTALYRVRVMKPASSEAQLTGLTVNGESVTIGDGTDLGLVQVTGDTATLAATVSAGASVLLGVDGKAAENHASVSLEKSLNMVTIRVVAEDGVTESLYTLALSKPDPDNAELYLLKLGGMTLSPAFDPAVTDYDVTNYGNASLPLSAIAAQGDATVTYETVAEYETDTGRVSGPCRFFKDEGLANKVTVTVTSPNGKHTTTYTVNVDVVESAYLSDLPWVSATSGWQSVRRDYDVDPNGGKLSLMENGQTVTYEKGLGTHANSVIVYDLSPWGFTTLTTKVGMDHSQTSNTTQRLRFYVDLDGENQHTSGDLGSTMNCEAVNVNVAGGKELTLRVIYTTANDGNAHADWADAKLSSNIPLLSQTTDIPVKHIEFEHETHTIYVNEDDPYHTMELHPVLRPSGATHSAHQLVLKWDSSDDSVATVHDGVVTAVAIGEAEISATALGGATDVCAVTVKKVVEGELTANGALKFGSTLTANDSTFDADVRANLTYTWYRDTDAPSNLLAEGKTYVPVEEDIGHVLVLKAAPKAEATYYEGEATFTTGEIKKADGPAMLETPTHRNVSAEGATDGAITGLFKGRTYEYLKWDLEENGEPDDEEAWIPFCDDSAVEEPAEGQTRGTAEITGLGEGSYVVRRAGDNTHNPGPISSPVQITVRTPDMYDLTNPTNFEGGVVRTSRTQVREGDTVTLRVTPSTGYRLAEGSLKAVTEDGTEYMAAETATAGTYTFSMPAANVTIQAEFVLKTYTIGHEMSNILCSLGDEASHTATHGEAFTVTLTPEEGYNMPRTLTVTETDTGRRFTDFDYAVDETDPAKRVLTFANGVTCNITISGAATLKTYTVVYELTNGLTASGAPQTATHGKELSVTLSAARGYARPEEIGVTMAGEELTGEEFTYDPETGAVTIGAVTGNVVLTAQGEALDVPLQSAVLVGPARVGRTLTVNVVPALATVEYQWILVDEDGTETDIEGATEERYVIPAEAEGKAIRVRVTGTDHYDGTLTTAPTETILAASEPFVFVTGIELSTQEAEVAAGNTITLTATVTPDKATAPALSWTSDNEAIATVDQRGVVTGVAEGTVTITASSTDTVNAVTATCTVTVTKATGGGTTTPAVPVVTTPEEPTTKVKENEDGTTTTTVTEPDGTVTVTTTDENGEVLAEVKVPGIIPETDKRFEDVPVGHWADKAIHQLAAIEVVNGVTDTTYSPVAPMKRGDLATVLYRLSNKPAGGELSFEDVPESKYYAEGIAWAAKVGVVEGFTEEEFQPETVITREQLALMLLRYAKLLGMDTGADAEVLDAFADGSTTHAWAVNGMAWCVKNGILQGRSEDTLAPTSNVTRAEVAVMIDRFLGLVK